MCICVKGGLGGIGRVGGGQDRWVQSKLVGDKVVGDMVDGDMVDGDKVVGDMVVGDMVGELEACVLFNLVLY